LSSPEPPIDAAQLAPASFVVYALGDLEPQAEALRQRLAPLIEIDGARLVLDVGAAFGLGDAVVAVIREAAASVADRAGQFVIVTHDPWATRALRAAPFPTLRVETSLTRGIADGAA
jgi:anti-anti-sigma regulatory factor